VRALAPEDVASARALVLGQFGGTRYEARSIEVLEDALIGSERGALGVVRGDGEVLALIVHGAVAGAQGVLRVDYLAGDPVAARALAESVVMAAEGSARLMAAELPDDACFALTEAGLVVLGFQQEACIPDLVAEGVALRVFTRRAGS